jgi:hypothetical protein
VSQTPSGSARSHTREDRIAVGAVYRKLHCSTRSEAVDKSADLGTLHT